MLAWVNLLTTILSAFLNPVGTSDDGRFVPIVQIPGTSLYSGLYYQVGMKRFPDGRVTFTAQETQERDGFYMQIDSTLNNLPHYVHGQKWEADVHWAFDPVPATGYFFMRNKALPHGIIALRKEQLSPPKYLILVTSPDSLAQFGKKGGHQDQALIKPVGTKLLDFYRLEFKTCPEGTVTYWTERNYNLWNQFIYLDESRTSFYQENEEGFENALYHFPSVTADEADEPHFAIQAVLQNSQLSETQHFDPDLELIHGGTESDMVSRQNGQRIPIRFQFDQDVSAWEGLSGVISIPNSRDKSLIKIGFQLNSAYMRNPGVYTAWVGDDSKMDGGPLLTEGLRFRAWVLVKGQADRMLLNGAGVELGDIPTDLVYERMLVKFDPECLKVVEGSLYVLITGNLSSAHGEKEVQTSPKEVPYYVPIVPIPGTKLLSGLYYQVGMKRFPEAFVGYEGSYVLIDQNPNYLPFYLHGHKWDASVHWGFQPVQQTGYYLLRNKALPQKVVTLRLHEGYTQLFLIPEHEYVQKEDMTVLFKPVGTKFENEYQLKSIRWPEGVATWTTLKYQKYNHYIQISTNPDDKDKYEEDGPWFNDTLFLFPSSTPETGNTEGEPHFALEAFVKNFEFSDIKDFDPDFQWKDDNEQSEIGSVYYHQKVQIQFRFDQDVSAWNLLQGFISMPNSVEKNNFIKIAFQLDNAHLTQPTLYSAALSHEVDLHLISPASMEKQTLGFRSWVLVRGQSDRMLLDGSVAPGPLPVYVIYDRMLAHDFPPHSLEIVDDKLFVLITGTLYSAPIEYGETTVRSGMAEVEYAPTIVYVLTVLSVLSALLLLSIIYVLQYDIFDRPIQPYGAN